MRGAHTHSWAALTTIDTGDFDMEASAALTLDNIRFGGANLLLSIRQRINEATGELDHGDFLEAEKRLTEAAGLVHFLGNAQKTLGIATGHIIRASELEVGMTMTDIGEVTKVEPEDCGHSACPGHFAVTIGRTDNPPLHLDGDHTIFVEATTDES